MKRADRKRWELTVAKRQGSGREAVAERSRRQTPDHRNTKRQRGRMRATSVLRNAKSKDHQDASSRAAWHGRKAHVLTQGDLSSESRTGVSRGHSSDEAVRKHGGAKGRRSGSKATREPMNRTTNAQTSAERSGQPRTAARTQTASVVQPQRGARREANRQTCGTQGTNSNARGNDGHAIRPREIKIARHQPPDAENRTSGGVGALTGANPVRATRSPIGSKVKLSSWA